MTRIGMWSGPRNISTAMMRAFENRADTAVCDEPLYAYYLERTGLDHPGAQEIIATGETDPRKVADELTGPIPKGATIFYQKQMAHHLVGDVPRDWLGELDHAFLIRDPREMLLSLSKVTPHPRIEDTGLPQQLELFEDAKRRSGRIPPVLDARDVLEDPEGMLRALCAVLNIPFDERMLAWPAGPRDTDGIWAKHWYASVERSTGFEPWRPREGDLRAELTEICARCQEPYEALFAERLRP